MPPSLKDAFDQQGVIPNPADGPVLHSRFKVSDLPLALTIPKPIRPDAILCLYTGSKDREFFGVSGDEFVCDHRDYLLIARGPQRKESNELVALVHKVIEFEGTLVVEPRQDAEQRTIHRMLVRELGIRELFPRRDFNDVSDFGT